MSSILVVEQEQRSFERISQALSADGLRVRPARDRAQALQAVAAEPPDLILLSAGVPDAGSLASSFSRNAGGPGVVLLLPERSGPGPLPGAPQADDRLIAPFSDEELRAAVRRALAARRPSGGAGAGAQPQMRLTSQDIFGDVLAEVEGTPLPATPRPQLPQPAPAPGRPSPAAAVQADPGAATTAPLPVPPRAVPPAPGEAGTLRPAGPPPAGAALRAPAAAPPGAPRDEEINRKLEKTLSGVLGIPSPVRKPQAPAARPEKANVPASGALAAGGSGVSEIDALLSKTLSKLELPAKPKAPAASPPAGAPATPAAQVPLSPAAPALPAAPTAPAAPDTAPAQAAAVSGVPAQPAGGARPPAPADEVTGVRKGPRPLAPVDLSELEDLARTGRRVEPGRLSGGAGAAGEVGGVAGAGGAGAPTTPVARMAPSPPRAAQVSPAATQRIQVVPREAFEGGNPAGERFGQYTLLERIAVGGMAEVWKARMRGVEGFQKTVAIKKILSYMTDNSEFVTMFIDEAKLAAQLSHPNIIHIYDLGKIGRDFYIAMEYVDGKDLRSLLNASRRRGEALPLGLALLIAARLAGALDYAHRKRDYDGQGMGLVHRDVSPQNVLISYEGEVKLCDFGIAKAVSKAGQTQMGALKGKLQYMSPEQAWGRAVDARTDIFSLGSVLFEMITGERLFPGDTEMSVLEAVRQAQVRPVREVDPTIPPDVEEIVGRALARQPEDRFQTAGELEQRLVGVLYALKPSPTHTDLAAFVHRVLDGGLAGSGRQPGMPPLPLPSAVRPEAQPAGGPGGSPPPSLAQPMPPRAGVGAPAGGPGTPGAAPDTFDAGAPGSVAAGAAGQGTPAVAGVPGPVAAGSMAAGAAGAAGSLAAWAGAQGILGGAGTGATPATQGAQGTRGTAAAAGTAAAGSAATGTAAASSTVPHPPSQPPADGTAHYENVVPIALPAEAALGEGERRGRGLLIAAIVILLLAAVAIVFVSRSRRNEPPGPARPKAQGAQAPLAVTPAGAAPAVSPAGGATAASPAGAAQAKGVPSAPVPATGTQKVDVEGLVGQAMAQREQQMRQKYTEEQKRLEQQIAQARNQPARPSAPAAGTPPPGSVRAPASAGEAPSSAPPTTLATRPAAPLESAERGKEQPVAVPPLPADARSAAASPPVPLPQTTTATAPATSAEPARSTPAPAAARQGEQIAEGSAATPPTLVSIPKPEYPPLARKLGVEGTVLVSLLVDENGRVEEVHILEAVRQKVGINEAALEAARRARYTPAMKDGVRVKMWTRLRIPFKL